jgi:ribosomal protein L33
MIMNFQTLLKKGTWGSDYKNKDPNHMFNSFLCTFLNIFHTSYPVFLYSELQKNDWITQGIIISWKHKRSLYTLTKNSNEPKAKVNRIKYCGILRKLIKEAKEQHYNRLTAKSSYKIKTTWNIIKKQTGKVHSVEQVPTLGMVKN